MPLPPPDRSARYRIDKPRACDDTLAARDRDLTYTLEETAAGLVAQELRELRH